MRTGVGKVKDHLRRASDNVTSSEIQLRYVSPCAMPDEVVGRVRQTLNSKSRSRLKSETTPLEATDVSAIADG